MCQRLQLRVSAVPNKLLSLSINTLIYTDVSKQCLPAEQQHGHRPTRTHTHTQFFLRSDKHFLPKADWHSDDLPFHITLLRWLRCKQDIAPNRPDRGSDRPPDMDVEDVSKTSLVTWVMLMLWHSRSRTMMSNLEEVGPSELVEICKLVLKKWTSYLEETLPSQQQLHELSGSRLLSPSLLGSQG